VGRVTGKCPIHGTATMFENLHGTHEVICCGYLSKKGEKRRNWTKRWFNLKSDVLTYHKHPGVRKLTGFSEFCKKKAKGMISLADASDIEVDIGGVEGRKQVRDYCLKITVKSKGRVYIIDTSSEERMHEWMMVITAVINKNQDNV
jgi:hypothetical protein